MESKPIFMPYSELALRSILRQKGITGRERRVVETALSRFEKPGPLVVPALDHERKMVLVVI